MLSLKEECKAIAKDKGISVRGGGSFIEVTYRENWKKKFRVFDTWEQALEFIKTI